MKNHVAVVRQMWNVSAKMSEFKYACPVCGQHISCDSSQAGLEMTCPTCFQKIIPPQTSASSDTKLILTGIKAGDRPAATPSPTSFNAPKRAPGFPGALVVGLILLFIGVVVAFIYHGTIFKTSTPGAGTNQVSTLTESNPPDSNNPANFGGHQTESEPTGR